MVNTQTGDAAVFQQFKKKLMDGVKDHRVFDANRCEIVDVKETAIVNLFCRNLPVAQSVGLRIQ